MNHLPRLSLVTFVAPILIWGVFSCTETNPDFPVHDAKSSGESYSVGGTVSGLEAGDELRLSLNADEVLSVSDNGVFTFESLGNDGETYEVTILDGPTDKTCWVDRGMGIVLGPVGDIDVECGRLDANLSALTISTVDGVDPEFASATTDYNLEVSVLVQEIRLTPTAIDATARITIGGQQIDSGSESSPIPLSLGANTLEIEVTVGVNTRQTYVVVVTRGQDVIEQVLYAKASNTEEEDHFGFPLAVSGDTLVVAARDEDSSSVGIGGDQGNGALSAGAVYVFRRDGDNWVQEAYIKAANAQANDDFGRSVAVFGDRLAVGARLEDSAAVGVNGSQASNTAEDSGAAYVYRRMGVTWELEAYVKASNTLAGDQFGRAVALSDDTLVVGAADEGGQSGAAYVFRRTETNWEQEAIVKATNSEARDFFGRDVALSDDTMVVGASGEDSSAVGVGGNSASNASEDSGAAYVFRRSGTIWSQEAYLKPSNTGSLDFFGRKVAIASNTVAVTSTGEDSSAVGINGDQTSSAAQASGAVYVFRRVGNTWSQEAYVKASNTGAGDGFGESVVLSNDMMAVGANQEDGNGVGVGSDQGNNSAGGSGAVPSVNYFYPPTTTTFPHWG